MPAERETLLRGEPEMSFPCAAERFVARRLKLVPTRMWEDPIDATRGDRRYEIRQRQRGDGRPFKRLNPSEFDVLALCLWTIVPGRSGGIHLVFECRLITAEAIRLAGTAKLNSLISAAPVRVRGKAFSIAHRKLQMPRAG